MLPVSLDCAFLIAPLVFSKINLLVFWLTYRDQTQDIQEQFEDIKG